MKIAIIDYGAGNVKSIEFALQRLGYSSELTSSTKTIKGADRVIFPGVGEASSAMKMLKSTGLDLLIPTLEQPVLGICLGMQLMCSYCEEGDTRGLNIFDTKVVKFNNQLKVPQVGWNTIIDLKTDLFKGVEENSYMYLVHSFYVPAYRDSIANSSYGVDYSVALHKNNFYGVQFHPEKSGKIGEQILKNFIEIR
ncbi:imidazole glycerol phosphate synthase amidotransferase subunit HisH [Psychroflexus torquis ATCC 700755]|uniref:Imidazole glycerol phosphate synthase subunit HisH n=1 Tax=Psychroflexus torquis (strain ATCC 700755 / CIP 106069 / ACAM 623) TaxID=313595 RepID=K4IN06_PSYTT|nr:imidazole glycerol phosphate synthase subunit HisH [Psychroflexus torquis]AFU70436.1 imidazole glycerol phosphate synthase amidotransferase subunit HisH [Psychroflexus torquis ATCC 700755]